MVKKPNNGSRERGERESNAALRIGVLAVQGDYEAHGRMLEKLGAEPVYVRTPADLQDIQGLVLPGGESTTQWKFLIGEGLLEPVRKFASEGKPVFGTCAGAILLAREVKNPDQESLKAADLVAVRNAYGRQLASEVRMGKTKLRDEPVEMVFIRAPTLEGLGTGVEVLAESNGDPVLVRQGRMLIATFHPELTDDPTIHEYFLRLAQNGS